MATVRGVLRALAFMQLAMQLPAIRVTVCDVFFAPRV
jgi:hypothetical protein